MRKESSTNSLNRNALREHCGMVFTLSMIGGRWKPGILYCLVHGKMRYNELRKQLPDVSERMLVLQLRELESDGLVRRLVYAEVPPRVEYELTEAGISLKPVLKSMSDWGLAYQKKRGIAKAVVSR
jgi:DNA-binding HxlR family transcriptional regulator